MIFKRALLTQPGEHHFFFQGKIGQLEAKIRVPEYPQHDVIAMLGHPHSLHGGSMTNKVVTTLARTMSEAGISSICFNFRGVGKSEGEYADGIGESDDMVLLMQEIESSLDGSYPSWILAGFSFGSFVTYRAALNHPTQLLISVAPPVMRYDYTLAPICPWWILQGDADEIVEASKVSEFVQTHPAKPHFISFSGASHFFHGNLLVLREKLSSILKEEGLGNDIA